MDISISEQHQDHIKRKVESGDYGSPDEVIGKALELLDERDQVLAEELADMHEKVRRSTDQADSGQLIPANEVFDELRQRNASMTN
jgi:putative addiction module CopG family antidote